MPVREDERDRERPDVEGRPERDAQDARDVVPRKERPVGAPGACVHLKAGHHGDRDRPDEENPADEVPRAAPEDHEPDGGRREETDGEQDRRPDGNALVGAESVEDAGEDEQARDQGGDREGDDGTSVRHAGIFPPVGAPGDSAATEISAHP